MQHQIIYTEIDFHYYVKIIYILMSKLYRENQENCESPPQTFTNILRNNFSTYHKKLSSHKSMLPGENCDLDDVQTNIDAIAFQYRGGYNQYLYNRDLRITNNSGAKISFKIKSNNPDSYDVCPHRQTIEDQRSCQIRIKLFMTTRNPNIYNQDKFMIEWKRFELQDMKDFTSPFQTDHSQKTAGIRRKTLRVKIEYEKVERDIKEEKDKEQRELIMYNEILAQNLKKINKYDEEIAKREKIPLKKFTVTKSMLICVGLLAFGLGYVIG